MRVPWFEPAARPVHPIVPFSQEYVEIHRSFVTQTLETPKMIGRFARARRLPHSFGIGLDERVVEYPWLLAQNPAGRVLDAGSTLNHPHILDLFLPLFASLHIVTLGPEEHALTERGISYVYCDVRDLPFRDGYYDVVLSISTLEHVGMDNARYGAIGAASGDPRDDLRRAVAELKRVLAPGGTFLATVPYGRYEDHGWFRQFDHTAVDELLHCLSPRRVTVTTFAYSRNGWQLSSLAAAADARYRDSTFETASAEDLAVAARAVACIHAIV